MQRHVTCFEGKAGFEPRPSSWVPKRSAMTTALRAWRDALYQVLCAAYRSTCWQVTLPSQKSSDPKIQLEVDLCDLSLCMNLHVLSSCSDPLSLSLAKTILRVNEWGPVARVGSAALTLHRWTVDSEDPLDGVTKSRPDAST